jgi:hypothetical protein
VPPQCSALPALWAEAVNRQTVIKNRKPFIRKRCQVHSPVSFEPDIVHTTAPLANEVIVVFKGRIIASAAFAETDRTDLSFFRQPLQIAIDRPETYTW